MRTIAGMATLQETPERSAKKAARMMGTKAFATPNRIAPVVFASMSSSRGIGARSSLSKEWLFFSNVTVTASMEVVPKRIEIAATPGSSDSTSAKLSPDLMKNIPVQAKGKINPQLMFGGLR